ncbi:MAG: hypothetical protein ACI8VW_004075, partial [bacterium]
MDTLSHSLEEPLGPFFIQSIAVGIIRQIMKPNNIAIGILNQRSLFTSGLFASGCYKLKNPSHFHGSDLGTLSRNYKT